MAVEQGLGAVGAFALVGVLGVGAQWVAWRLRMPAIVFMLAVGLLAGPVTGLFDPARDLGPVYRPMISLAVAVILFEGGMSLDFQRLGDARRGVRRLVVVGAPLGWLLSAFALHWGAGLSWAASAVFGGIMIVTGPTVIAPLLRMARLQRRPAQLLQWEAIVNDPIGALAAVLAYEVVVALDHASGATAAMLELGLGISVAALAGALAGAGLAFAFRRGHVPEYMKVPVLFVTLLGIFAATDSLLHESGLLAVTVMGLVIGNARLPSGVELRRFKEHATILLVSGVFILIGASMSWQQLGRLDWHAAAFIAAVVLFARPLTVMVALAGSDVPMRERIFIAFTGPRGIVLIAVAGLFGQQLAELGHPEGELFAPLAFVLVLATVVLHGFTLGPVARRLGLTGGDRPGVLLVGGSRFTTALGEALVAADVPVLVTDPNHSRLARPRAAGVPTWYGDILSEAGEDRIELIAYSRIVAATDNDAYNTLVATDLGPELGREAVWQLARARETRPRHALPSNLGGRALASGLTLEDLERRMEEGWRIRRSDLTAKNSLADWRARRPEAVALARLRAGGEIDFIASDAENDAREGDAILALIPPDPLLPPAPERRGAPMLPGEKPPPVPAGGAG